MDGPPPVGDPDHVGPKITPRWLDVVRQIIIFVLGVWLIVFAATTNGHDIPFIVTGLVLLGMIPVERALRRRE
jgi:hypothetical protein